MRPIASSSVSGASTMTVMMMLSVMHTISALPAIPSTSHFFCFSLLSFFDLKGKHTYTHLCLVGALSSGSHSLSNGFPALNTSSPANLTDSDDNNVITIVECGEEKVNVQRAYSLARDALMAAKADVAHGSHSPFGFSAMFKNDGSKYAVSDNLNQIYYSHGLSGLKPDPAHLLSPRLACVQRNSASVFRDLRLGYDPWERCFQGWFHQRYPHQVFYASRTAYIFLCPDFHDQALAPAGSHCPTVVDNRFAGDMNVFYRDYQMYTLLYGLIRFCLQRDALSSKSVPNEVFDWNQCVGYTPQSSMKNPTNLLLYIACRLPFLFPLAPSQLS